jgi:hypothetical protein
MNKTRDEVLGAIQTMIGPIGHLSNPNATDPFKRSLYSALMYIYDASTTGAPTMSDSPTTVPVDLSPILKELQDIKDELKAMKERREIFEAKIKRLEAANKSTTTPKP